MPAKGQKLILLLMIKNESKIIDRCLRNAEGVVDAISILDTGSTDDTVEVATSTLKSIGKPFKIMTEPWKNFGYNRTKSMECCVQFAEENGWDLKTTYALAIDADMNLVPSEAFKEYPLVANGYLVIQKTPYIKYYNSRIMKLSEGTKCIGATHEYWAVREPEKLPETLIHIDDKNDGGCKADKYERDAKLLEDELKEQPDNSRTTFYLAQTYKDLGKNKDAIKMYKKRIAQGGWFEEVWFSHFMTARCYERIGDDDKMELWVNRAYKYYPKRAEALCMLVQHLRQKGKHHKAYHYYLMGKDIPFPHDNVLFIENHAYEGLFDYENTILSCYVHKKNHKDAFLEIIEYINKKICYSVENVWGNMEFYADPIVTSENNTKYMFSYMEEFSPSSCSLAEYKGKTIMNVRYVNYDCTKKNEYPVRSEDKIVRTKNAFVYMNTHLSPSSDLTFMGEDSSLNKYPTNIMGYEDVRLFTHCDELYFTATAKDLIPETKYRMALGKYNIETDKMHDIKVILSPINADCEKNWVTIPSTDDKIRMIYTWYPLQIIEITNNSMDITRKIDTPIFFHKFRGSTNLVNYDNKLWTVVHFVKHSTPRVYFHVLIQLNKETFKPEQYSVPFFFKEAGIEYCLGLSIKNDRIRMVYSSYDSNPCMVETGFGDYKFISTF